MQYPCAVDREGLASLATRFIEALSADDAQAALNCLHDTAYLCVQSHFLAASGREGIAERLETFARKAGRTTLENVQTIVDAKNGRVAVACSMSPTGGARQENTMFFRVRDDRIQEAYLYIAGENLFA